MNFKEKIINAIYAQCAMDSIGNPFEFKYDIDGNDVVKYADEAEKLTISDDSQMALFGLEAIKNLQLYEGDIFEQVRKSFTDSYIDWYLTQTCDKTDSLNHDIGLLSFKSMYSVQAPGNTCLSALFSLINYESVKNDSKGCGATMRLLPLVSLLDKYSFPDVNKMAKITGAITHKHKDNDAAISQYMTAASRIIRGVEVDCPVAGHISELGEGWIAPECVDMAIWAYCHAESFDELLALSIAHDGDSDSVAAIAGSLWGLSGKEVPKKYIEKLDALDAIEYIISKI